MKKIFLTFLMLAILASNSVFAQEEKPLTQEQFAVELVKAMKLQNLLPKAPLPRDAVKLLDHLGIAPMTGWKNKELLGREDYLVIIGKAQGKENLVHQRALEVEEKNIEIINAKWQQAFDEEKKWPSLSELLKSEKFFPKGAPKSPYGIKYRDTNGDHKIDPYFSPIASLIEIRESLSTR